MWVCVYHTWLYLFKPLGSSPSVLRIKSFKESKNNVPH